MVYRNTVTGALIETSCQVAGGNWVAVPTAAQSQEAGVQGPQEQPLAPARKARKAKVSG
ncbi:hypothetical protein [Allofournierella sp.]|uniref:hypothetical protein n=1 Tax=Allofournierella sp. TaxID=1940256 RepID=UPI003AF1921C